MKRHSDHTGLRTACALAALAALMLSWQGGATASARGLSTLRPAAAADCEGDACSQVSVSFDEARQQYRTVNNSADRWTHVTASNMAASASACIAPGKDAYLPLKSIAGSYHAEYAEARCGEAAAAGPPAE